MKKALIVLLLLAVAGGLFAQGFTIGGRVDTHWVPFQFIKTDGEAGNLLSAGLGRDNGTEQGNRARLFGSATSEDGTLGARIYLQFFPGNSATGALDAFGFDDFVDVWWKPFPQLTLDVGKYVNDTLRGKVGDHWFRKYTVGNYNPDAIFTRFASGGVDIGGAGDLGVLALAQFGDLTVGVNFPQLKPFGLGTGIFGNGIGGGGAAANPPYEANTYADGRGDLIRAYQRTQAAIGYNIPDIGLARVQFVGANPSITVTNKAAAGNWGAADLAGFSIKAPRIEAAFALTAVEGLTLDIGGKFVLPTTEASFKVWNEDTAKWEAGYYVAGVKSVLPIVAGQAPQDGVRGDGRGPDGITGTPDDLPDADAVTAVPARLIPAGTYKAPVQVGLGGIYTAGAFTFTGRVDANFMGGAEIKERNEAAPDNADSNTPEISIKQGLEVNAHIWPTYDLGFMVLGLDFGFIYKGDGSYTIANDTTTVKGGMMFGGGLFVNKVIGGCTIRAGLAYSHAATYTDKDDPDSTDVADRLPVKADTVFSIPVVFEFNF